MSAGIKDRAFIVTGAASGIGWATARLLHDHGGRVALWDRNREALQDNAARRDIAAGSCLAVTVDVASPAEVSAAMATSLDFLGGLDGAFNNAGVGAPTVPLADVDAVDFDRTLAVNLKGVFLCMQQQLKYLRDHGGGSIVNNASVAGLVALAGQGAYTASKHGVVGLSKAAAVENAEHRIRVNAVCPGAVRTPILGHLSDAGISEEALAAMSPQNRIADPAEIAEAVVWLLSSAAGFVTGAAMPVDGGWSAR